MNTIKSKISAVLLAIGLAAVVAGTVHVVSADAKVADGGHKTRTAVTEPWKRIGQGSGGGGGIGGSGGVGGFGGSGGYGGGSGGVGGTGGSSPLHE
jgi:hypothetical protein